MFKVDLERAKKPKTKLPTSVRTKKKTRKFQMFKLDLERAEEPEIK